MFQISRKFKKTPLANSIWTEFFLTNCNLFPASFSFKFGAYISYILWMQFDYSGGNISSAKIMNFNLIYITNIHCDWLNWELCIDAVQSFIFTNRLGSTSKDQAIHKHSRNGYTVIFGIQKDLVDFLSHTVVMFSFIIFCSFDFCISQEKESFSTIGERFEIEKLNSAQQSHVWSSLIRTVSHFIWWVDKFLFWVLRIDDDSVMIAWLQFLLTDLVAEMWSALHFIS